MEKFNIQKGKLTLTLIKTILTACLLVLTFAQVEGLT